MCFTHVEALELKALLDLGCARIYLARAIILVKLITKHRRTKPLMTWREF
jgi:hypothetical protein